jgi:hypothetical protein
VTTDAPSYRNRRDLHEGVLYRPAQERPPGYGGASAIKRVDELSTEFAAKLSRGDTATGRLGQD